MKKLLMIILIAALVLTLVSCCGTGHRYHGHRWRRSSWRPTSSWRI